jgi:preprotein translocase subunit YajC
LISFAPILVLLIYLSIFGFIIYFLINILQFMRRKNDNDLLLLQKIDELAKKLDELKREMEETNRICCSVYC